MAGVRFLRPVLGLFVSLNAWGGETLQVKPLVETAGMVPGIEMPFLVQPSNGSGIYRIEVIKVKSEKCQARRDRFRVNLFLVKCAAVEKLQFEISGRYADRIHKFEAGPYQMNKIEVGYSVLEDIRLKVEGVQ